MWLEIITVRINPIARDELDAGLHQYLAEVRQEQTQPSFTAYSFKRAPSGLDISIHLHHDKEINKASATGKRLAEALREFGPVDHAIWLPLSRD